ncbi:MAG TPA: hypothetical protein VNR36_01310 [Pseudolysinimonas sp.]|nr:hypothetical protein [Pseudolysinimonas sp.]
MGLFQKRGTDETLPKGDRGKGSFDDYSYGLTARNARITMTLADSDPHQHELRQIVETGDAELETAMSPRTIEQERVDSGLEVRLFTGRRVSGVVGSIPRGLESVIDETLRRLEDRGDKPRIPARITGKPGAYRVELLMGRVR